MIRWWLLLAAAGVAVSACSSGSASLASSASRHETTGAGLINHSPVPDDRVIAPGRGCGSASAPAAVHVMSRKAGPATLPQVTYPSLGINVSAGPPAAPGKLAADASSPGAVLAAFKAQGDASLVGSALATERPAIALRTITELHPTAPGVRSHVPYPGWVVTYRHIRLVSYGLCPFPRNAQGTFVAIMDAATGQWTNFFNQGSLRA
jgi:hypothetical protein